MSETPWSYGEGCEPIPAISAPTVMFMINQCLAGDKWDDKDVYRCTRCGWHIGERARYEAVYALGVSHGVVRGAYRIREWTTDGSPRWCFNGTPAPWLKVIGTSIDRLKRPKGAANPVRLYLDGVPE